MRNLMMQYWIYGAPLNSLCGKIWLDCFVNALPRNGSVNTNDEKSETCFKFGYGNPFTSTNKVRISVRMISRKKDII